VLIFDRLLRRRVALLAFMVRLNGLSEGRGSARAVAECTGLLALSTTKTTLCESSRLATSCGNMVAVFIVMVGWYIFVGDLLKLWFVTDVVAVVVVVCYEILRPNVSSIEGRQKLGLSFLDGTRRKSGNSLYVNFIVLVSSLRLFFSGYSHSSNFVAC